MGYTFADAGLVYGVSKTEKVIGFVFAEIDARRCGHAGLAQHLVSKFVPVVRIFCNVSEPWNRQDR